jgi:hypothetical protein
VLPDVGRDGGLAENLWPAQSLAPEITQPTARFQKTQDPLTIRSEAEEERLDGGLGRRKRWVGTHSSLCDPAAVRIEDGVDRDHKGRRIRRCLLCQIRPIHLLQANKYSKKFPIDTVKIRDFE